MNMQKYWANVQQMAATLPEEVLLIAVDTTKPRDVVACLRSNAAERLVMGSHRIATEEEATRSQQREVERLKFDRQREARRDSRKVLVVRPEDISHMPPVPPAEPPVPQRVAAKRETVST